MTPLLLSFAVGPETNRLYLAVWHFPGGIFKNSSVGHLMLENIWNGFLCMCVWESERETCGAVIPCPFWAVSSLFPSVWIVTVLPHCPHPREPNTCREARAHTFAYRHILAVDSLLHLWDGPFFFFFPTSFYLPNSSLYPSLCMCICWCLLWCSTV